MTTIFSNFFVVETVKVRLELYIKFCFIFFFGGIYQILVVLYMLISVISWKML